MCEHLLKAGYSLSVFNRTKSKTDELLQKGAVFKTPEEIAKDSDAVFLMLGYPHDLEEIVFSEKGILKHMKQGSFLIDHTTSSPALAERIYHESAKHGVKSLDCPVSGGDVGAKNGKLVVMAGGDESALTEINPILEKYSAVVKHMGKAGNGQHTKMANQIFIASNMVGVSEGLIYGYKAGLNLEQMIELLKQGAAGSFSLANLAPRMLARNFDPGFYVEHFIKDLGIALDESRRMNLSLPGLALANQLYLSLVANGGAKFGTQALLLTLEKLSNVDLSKKE